MMRAVETRWGSFWLAVFLLSYRIALCAANCPADGLTYAVTTSETTLLKNYGPSGSIITTLPFNECIKPICSVRDAYVEDDPFWIRALIPSLGIEGWVADYFADCGYVGFCQLSMCP